MNKLALTIISAAALVLTVWQVGRAHESFASFQIIVQTTEKGVILQCAKGCAWKTATYSCNARSRPNDPIPIIDGVPVTGDSLQWRSRNVDSTPRTDGDIKRPLSYSESVRGNLARGLQRLPCRPEAPRLAATASSWCKTGG